MKIMEYMQDNIEKFIGDWPEQVTEWNNDSETESSCFYRNDMDSTYHMSENQTEWNNRRYDEMLKDFKRDYEIEGEITEEHQNDLTEYECEYFQPVCLMIRIENDVVQLRLSYKDVPYYRELSFEMIKTIPVETLNND